jgi:hypothetical protein
MGSGNTVKRENRAFLEVSQACRRAEHPASTHRGRLYGMTSGTGAKRYAHMKIVKTLAWKEALIQF